jgi:hypothetical protein
MELNRRPCVVSCGIGGAYPFGIDRLEKSLHYHGWSGETSLWRTYPDGCPEHKGDDQYAFKVYSLLEAYNKGCRVLLWLDSSIYLVKDLMPVFDYISDNGLFFFRTGYPLSATATDKMLDYAAEKREDLVEVPEFATGCVGISMDHPRGMEFLRQWTRYMQMGLFGGNRVRDKADSSHPLFMFSREDQSAASMILHKMGITETGQDKKWVCYYPHMTDETILVVKGL